MLFFIKFVFFTAKPGAISRFEALIYSF